MASYPRSSRTSEYWYISEIRVKFGPGEGQVGVAHVSGPKSDSDGLQDCGSVLSFEGNEVPAAIWSGHGFTLQ